MRRDLSLAGSFCVKVATRKGTSATPNGDLSASISVSSAFRRVVVGDDRTNALRDLTVTFRRRTSTSIRCSLPLRSPGLSSTPSM